MLVLVSAKCQGEGEPELAVIDITQRPRSGREACSVKDKINVYQMFTKCRVYRKEVLVSIKYRERRQIRRDSRSSWTVTSRVNKCQCSVKCRERRQTWSNSFGSGIARGKEHY
jgi:hypothetical protein